MKRTIIITGYDFKQDKIITLGKIHMENKKITFEGFPPSDLDRLQRGVPYKEKLRLPDKEPEKFWLGVLEDWNRKFIGAEEI
jgi:hypothetical protein